MSATKARLQAMAAARNEAELRWMLGEWLVELTSPDDPAVHKPFTDDGVIYCGWASDSGVTDGCGEIWPCRSVRYDRPCRSTEVCRDPQGCAAPDVCFPSAEVMRA